MLVNNGLVRVGMEIEVVRWTNGRTYQMVADELLKAGYMLGESDNWQEYHTYGCKCHLGCGNVRSGNIYYPPLVSITYDASLPITGAEFVTSAVLMEENGLDELKEIWSIVSREAVWDNKAKNKNGGLSSPSIHLHVSALDQNRPYGGPLSGQEQVGLINDIVHALSLFGPEFVALASTAGNVRGLSYRKPVRYADQNGHHGFVHVRKYNRGLVYIEWRVFEASYDDWDYIESAAYLSSSLTRALLNTESTVMQLMRGGYSSELYPERLEDAVRSDDSFALLQLVDPVRLTVLRDVCLSGLDDDVRGQHLLADLFSRTEEKYGH